MSNIKNAKIVIKEDNGNIFFESDFKSNNSNNLSFNLNSLKEIFNNINIIGNIKSFLDFDMKNEQFLIGFDGFKDCIRLSTNDILEVLYDAFFNDIQIPENQIIKNKAIDISQREHINNLIKGGKPNTALFFDGRVDIFLENKLIAVGKNACLELNHGEGFDLLALSGVVGNQLTTNASTYDVVIYQDNLKVKINNLTIDTIDSILDVKHIEFDFGNYNIEAQEIKKEESLELNNKNFLCYLGYDKLLEKEEILERISRDNSFDDLMAYSMDNKSLLPIEENNDSSFIDDDFFDNLF